MDHRPQCVSGLLIFVVLTLTGCFGGSGSNSPAPTPKPSPTYTISGTVSNLAGAGLALQNNSGDNIKISANGSFAFPTALQNGASYNVTVQTQPSNPDQTCAVSNGSGTVSGNNITNVLVTCTTTTYTIGGVIKGLTGSGLVLRNNSGDYLTITTNGSFTFGSPLMDNAAYNITVATQPTGQTCTVSNGSGIVDGANVTTPEITCTPITYSIGGTVAGLSGTGLVLQNNGGDHLAITSDGSFTFANTLIDGASYHVTVLTQPGNPSQTCAVNNGTGTVNGVDVAQVVVTCLSPPATPDTPSLSYGVKTFTFSWSPVNEATYYRLLENPDGVSGYSPIGGDIVATTFSDALSVPLWKRLNASYVLEACNSAGCSADSTPVFVSTTLAEAIGYVKASNTASNDWFGFSVALSDDGGTLAVGALFEDSAATGIDGNQADNTATDSGAVYVFTLVGGTWTQQAYIKASNTGANDRFGSCLALSSNGDTLVVSAAREDSAAIGVNGNQADNSATDSGAVYVFTRSGETWSQQAYIKASNSEAGDHFGITPALSGDGNTLAVGARYESSAAIGINGDQADNTAADSGAVYVFSRVGNAWSQQAYIKASNTGAGDQFGSLEISVDGNTLAVKAALEDSSATGIGGDQEDNTAMDSGAVYVFIRSNNTWSQQAYIKASNTGAGDQFGNGMSLSADGNTLAVGALFEDSSATGINGDQSDNTATDSGAVYVFTREGTTWSQQAYIKASSTGTGDQFGGSDWAGIALSDDGNTLVVGARYEDSNATGINGDQANNSATNSGAAYVFTRESTTWSQQAYIKAPNTETGDEFGAWNGLALSADGNTLAVGAYREDSAARGINGNQTSNGATDSGAVYIY